MNAPARPDAARLTVGVIGVGRVGAVIGAALARAGHQVVAVSAVSEASRDRAETFLPDAELLEPAEVCARASLVLLAVPDDALQDLVSGLAAVGAFQRGQLLMHVSGRHGLSVFAPAVGTLPMALHPVQTFTGMSLDLDRISGIAYGVTAPDELRPIAEALVLELGGEPVWVRDEDRPLWHAALAHASNHLVTLVTSAADLLRKAGAEDPGRVLAPLLSAALDGALRRGDAALTGPVSRGDAGTVAAHLAALPLEQRPAYLALARLTADRALASGRLTPSLAEGLLGVLS
ncbi:MAG TPA: Rossmann-like and DUF2520 domain-containing protein [Mycobacteriales bacterium]|nr:Rossmann-like and DUF2520 domain-containing protein [Mycobacteriales bacterium]